MQQQMIPTWEYCRVVWSDSKDAIEQLNRLGSECWEVVGILQSAPPDELLGDEYPIVLLKRLTGFRAAGAEAAIVVPGLQLGPRPV